MSGYNPKKRAMVIRIAAILLALLIAASAFSALIFR